MPSDSTARKDRPYPPGFLFSFLLCAAIAGFSFLSCSSPKPASPPPKALSSNNAEPRPARIVGSPVKTALRAGEIEDLPGLLTDDLDKASLVQAIENQLAVMTETDARAARLGNLVVSQTRLRETLEEFLRLIKADLPEEEFNRQVRETFVFYKAGDDENNPALFTGYYTPILKASRFRTDGYTYPIYRLPENLLKAALVERRSPADEGEYHSVYRARNLTREEIDARKALANQNLEIAWLQDEIEGYFLHVQGSGLLKYVNGAAESVQYVGSNGYPYVGIGKLMVRDGALNVEEASMQGIKSYLRKRPEDIPKYFFQNKRYIFFKLTDDVPRGSGGGALVAHRSIATDKAWYPAGGLAFVAGRKPVLNDNNELAGWRSFSRFVVDQDTGSAIKGPGRVDLYFGTGDRAGAAAGYYAARNKMFYLLKK